MKLIDWVAKLAPHDGDFLTDVPGVKLFRRSQPTTPVHCIYEPSLALIAQGQKRVVIGDDIYDYGPGQLLLTSLDLPVVSKVSEASSEHPYLGISVALDSRVIVQLSTQVSFSRRKSGPERALSVGIPSDQLVEAVTRLIALQDEPDMIAAMAPLVHSEIAIRLLKSPQGARLHHLIAAGTQGHQIATAVTWLKQHFTEALLVEDLADSVHMSQTTFRQHFRALTGMSPLQYQKQLRLQEARLLMLNKNMDAGTAALQVGYESSSQFSREYSRIFGSPPLRDVHRVRESTAAAAGRSLQH